MTQSLPNNPLSRAARELARDPDSPASLRLLSIIRRGMQRYEEAVQRVVVALADQIEQPTAPGAQGRVDAAIANYEAVTGQDSTPGRTSQFRADAQALVLERWRRPPPLESIITSTLHRSDVAYQMCGDLGGLRGTWHRLWASCSLAYQFGDNADEMAAAVLRQFEALLGREMTPEEWVQLQGHAKVHADRANSGALSPPK